MYDVCIVGAGPAGSTLARLISPRLRVLLVDRRHLDRPFAPGMTGKVCGGLLAPAAQRELARQGLGVPPDVTAGPQLFAVRTLDFEARLERHYQRFYLNVDREGFDRWLLSMVPARVDTLFGFSAHSIDTSCEEALVRFRSPNGASASVSARLVVGADGAGSVVAETLGACRENPPYVAVQGVFEGSTSDPYYGAYFDEQITDFYGWSIPKGAATSVGIALRRGRGARERFETFVQRLTARGCPIGALIHLESAPLRRPLQPSHIHLGGERLVLVGEAAGLISASSAEGISYALRSARALSEALESGLTGAPLRYRLAAAPTVVDAVGKLLKARAIYDSGARRLIMRSGVTAIPHTATAPRIGLTSAHSASRSRTAGP